GRPHRPHGTRRAGREGRRALHRTIATLPPPTSRAQRRLPDPRRRPESYRRRYGRLLAGLWRLVATPVHADPCLVVERGGVVGPGLRASIPAARVVGESSAVPRSCQCLVARVQPAVRPPVRVDMEQSQDEALVLGTRPLNSLQDFVAGPLVLQRKEF